jgi:hypothetical protein
VPSYLCPVGGARPWVRDQAEILRLRSKTWVLFRNPLHDHTDAGSRAGAIASPEMIAAAENAIGSGWQRGLSCLDFAKVRFA